MKKLSLILALLTVAAGAYCQGKIPATLTIRDNENNPVDLPHIGKKNLFIFYVDPDHGNQNKEFTDYLEENPITGPNIYCCGVINLKDAPMMPNGVIRSAIRKKARKTGQDIYTDPDHILRDAWGLGDVNNLFTFILVNKEREIVYIKKGKVTKQEQKEMMELVEKYK